MTDLEKVKEVIGNSECSLVVLKENEINKYNNGGIKDLIYLLSFDRNALKGASIADKVVGKVAGAIMVKAGVKEVYTNLVSELAIPIFEKNNVKLEYKEKNAFIQNRDKTGMCPMEAKFKDENDIDVIWNEYIK